jgi:hypothetical protein
VFRRLKRFEKDSVRRPRKTDFHAFRYLKISLIEAPVLEIGWRATFRFAPCHEVFQFRANHGVHRRFFEIGYDVFQNAMGALCGPFTASEFSRLKIAPIADKRIIKSLLMAILSVLDAKKCPVGPTSLIALNAMSARVVAVIWGSM